MQLLKKSMLRNTYCLEMANMPSMKNTGERIVTLMISEQSHTRYLYLKSVFKIKIYCILLQHVNSLTFTMFILFIEMYL